MLKKIFKTVFIVWLVLMCMGGIVVLCIECFSHDHEYSSEWSYDELQHWHDCTGEDCEWNASGEEHIFRGEFCAVCLYSNTYEKVEKDEKGLCFGLSADGSYTLLGVREISAAELDIFPDKETYNPRESVKKLEVPEAFNNKKVTAIAAEAFSRYELLESVTISDGVKVIGENAFDNCVALKSVTIGENSKLESIGACAFRECGLLESITIPSGTAIYNLHPTDNYGVL